MPAGGERKPTKATEKRKGRASEPYSMQGLCGKSLLYAKHNTLRPWSGGHRLFCSAGWNGVEWAGAGWGMVAGPFLRTGSNDFWMLGHWGVMT